MSFHSRIDNLEITQGFHRTVKNKLIIHHIPGETGPSYGYFTLEPGMVKRACRISWNLVSGFGRYVYDP